VAKRNGGEVVADVCLPAKYASDYINVTQAPAQIVYDPQDPDHWFNYQGRVRSVKGPKNNKEPDYNGPFTKQCHPLWVGVKHSYYDEEKAMSGIC